MYKKNLLPEPEEKIESITAADGKSGATEQAAVQKGADQRLADVEADRQAALGEVNDTYEGMIESSDELFNAQSNAVGVLGEEQKKLQEERTAFELEKIQQQKDQAEKDYQKEQSAAYADFKRQTAKHGINAEQMADGGMMGSGYSESSQVAMYNQYQQRVAVARETIRNAYVAYDNAMTEARLSGDAAMAEIAFNTLSQQLEISLQGFNYKNDLLIGKLDRNQAIDSEYYGRWRDVLEDIQNETESGGENGGYVFAKEDLAIYKELKNALVEDQAVELRVIFNNNPDRAYAIINALYPNGVPEELWDLIK